MNIGNRIRERRKQLGITAEEIADKTNISRSTMYRYEQGAIQNIPAVNLKAIADVLEVSIDYLFGNTNSTDKPLTLDDVITPLNEPVFTLEEKRILEVFRNMDSAHKTEFLKLGNYWEKEYPDDLDIHEEDQ